jgi:hypothetical protein
MSRRRHAPCLREYVQIMLGGNRVLTSMGRGFAHNYTPTAAPAATTYGVAR